MHEFILASGNPHKAAEFATLLSAVKVVAAPSKIEVEETGKTFKENALLKAEAYYQKFKCPVLADDSGLIVEALPNELGVYSARYGGEGLDDKGRAMKLLEALKEVPSLERGAHFECHLCFYFGPEEIFFFEGRVEGLIGQEYVGEHGFGYDPIFHPKARPEVTMAQVPEWKDLNSHRAHACQHAEAFFSKRLGQST